MIITNRSGMEISMNDHIMKTLLSHVTPDMLHGTAFEMPDIRSIKGLVGREHAVSEADSIFRDIITILRRAINSLYQSEHISGQRASAWGNDTRPKMTKQMKHLVHESEAKGEIIR